MRTTGTFTDVYNAVRELQQDNTHSPSDPVIRREGNRWMLESRLEPTTADIEVSLDAFESWFYKMLKTDAQPSAEDIIEFVIASEDDRA